MDRHLSEPSLIAGIVEEWIATTGPIPFADYMQISLYSEGAGYYAKMVPGPAGDFTTAPALSPIFGMLLGRKIEQMWTQIGSPTKFVVTEVGAGGADLAEAIWKGAAGGFQQALELRIVERQEQVETEQRRRAADGGVPARWYGALSEAEPLPGCVVANEVIDNFPFDVFEVGEEGLTQLYVANTGGALQLEWRPAHNPEALEISSTLETGSRFELHSGVDEFARQAWGALSEGFLLVVDYGDEGPLLRASNPDGTAVTYRDQQLGTYLLESPGECDITAHVDFTRLEASCKTAGFGPTQLRTQRQFLLEAGISDVLSSLKKEADEAARNGEHGSFLQKTAERTRAAALVNEVLGNYKVLVAERGRRSLR